MPQFQNLMEIFKLLDKSNCRECNEKTCLAFAAAVFQGRKPLNRCTHIDREIIDRLGDKIEGRKTMEQEQDEAIDRLKRKIAGMDLAAAARRLEAQFNGDKLTIKICGKDFSVDTEGNLSSDIHVHSWIAVPFLNYVLKAKGVPASGKWVPYRELKGGKAGYRLFERRCEKELKRIADTYTDLFEDMIRIFNGRQVENHYESDISLKLEPLPKVPILICYWKPEDGFESSLNLFFDSTAEDNLNIESIYALGTGLVRMFEKLALRHGHQ